MCILDKPVQTNLPVSRPVYEVQLEGGKKVEGKNLRREREDVLQDLFKAFEKHQYYSFKDLVNLTKQPAVCVTANCFFLFFSEIAVSL